MRLFKFRVYEKLLPGGSGISYTDFLIQDKTDGQILSYNEFINVILDQIPRRNGAKRAPRSSHVFTDLELVTVK